TVSEGDVSGVLISLAPAITMLSITRVVGAPLKVKEMPGFSRAVAGLGSDPDQRDDAADRAIKPTCNVVLYQRGGGASTRSVLESSFRHEPVNEESGEFTIGDFLPDIYNVRVDCNAGYATSAL